MKPNTLSNVLRLLLGLAGLASSAVAGYRLENVTYPAAIRGGITGVTFSPTGTLVVATRYGEIWMRDSTGAWRQFARGLNEPMGLVAESDRVVYVAHRPELLRASDEDGDGRAETLPRSADSGASRTITIRSSSGCAAIATATFSGPSRSSPPPPIPTCPKRTSLRSPAAANATRA